jgi:hypothetical protein
MEERVKKDRYRRSYAKECSAYLYNYYPARPRYVAQRPVGQVTFCSDAAPVAETLCVQ